MSHTGNTFRRRKNREGSKGGGKTMRKRAVWWEYGFGGKAVTVATPDNKRLKGFKSKVCT